MSVFQNWKEMNYKLCDLEEFDSKPFCAVSRFLISAPFRLALVVLIGQSLAESSLCSLLFTIPSSDCLVIVVVIGQSLV